MTTITQQGELRIAEIVSGKTGIVVMGRLTVTDGPSYKNGTEVCRKSAALWNPQLDGEDWQKAQALQVVVWISKRMEGIDPADVTECTACKLAKIMAHEDTAALLSLGVELLG